jgi:hypothetical protein
MVIEYAQLIHFPCSGVSGRSACQSLQAGFNFRLSAGWGHHRPLKINV